MSQKIAYLVGFVLMWVVAIAAFCLDEANQADGH